MIRGEDLAVTAYVTGTNLKVCITDNYGHSLDLSGERLDVSGAALKFTVSGDETLQFVPPIAHFSVLSGTAEKASFADKIVDKGTDEEKVLTANPGLSLALIAVKSMVNDQTHSKSDVKDIIDHASYYGIRKIWMPVHIKPAKASCTAIDALTGDALTSALDAMEIKMLPDAGYVKEMIAYAESKGIAVEGVKIHSTWLADHYADMTPAKWMKKYTDGVNIVADAVGTHAKYMTVLNELYTICADSASSDNIISLLSHVRTKGYLTGLCGVYPTQAIGDASDIITYHRYPHMSTKCERTTIDDCITGWTESGLGERLYTGMMQWPTKMHFITETGVDGYWESLDWPEKHLSTGTESGGKSKALYFSALRTYLSDYPVQVHTINMWYPPKEDTAVLKRALEDWTL